MMRSISCNANKAVLYSFSPKSFVHNNEPAPTSEKFWNRGNLICVRSPNVSTRIRWKLLSWISWFIMQKPFQTSRNMKFTNENVDGKFAIAQYKLIAFCYIKEILRNQSRTKMVWLRLAFSLIFLCWWRRKKNKIGFHCCSRQLVLENIFTSRCADLTAFPNLDCLIHAAGYYIRIRFMHVWKDLK